jgi:hypothetical protein
MFHASVHIYKCSMCQYPLSPSSLPCNGTCVPRGCSAHTWATAFPGVATCSAPCLLKGHLVATDFAAAKICTRGRLLRIWSAVSRCVGAAAHSLLS